jgi:hypothetical protein
MTTTYALPNDITTKIASLKRDISHYVEAIANEEKSKTQYIESRDKVVRHFSAWKAFFKDNPLPSELQEYAWKDSRFESAIREYSQAIQGKEDEIKGLQSQIKKYEAAIAKFEDDLAKTPIKSYTKEQLKAAMPEFVADVGMVDGKIKITTKPILATINRVNPRFQVFENKIPIKPMNVYIHGSAGLVKFHAIGENGYDSGFLTNSPHPHIMGDNKACLGDFADPLIQAWRTNDLVMYLEIIHLFLSQVNADGDRAGESWPRMFFDREQLADEENTFVIDYRTNTAKVCVEEVETPASFQMELQGVVWNCAGPRNIPTDNDLISAPSGKIFVRRLDGSLYAASDYFTAPIKELVPKFTGTIKPRPWKREWMAFWKTTYDTVWKIQYEKACAAATPVAEAEPLVAETPKPKRVRRKKPVEAPAEPATAVVTAPTVVMEADHVAEAPRQRPRPAVDPTMAELDRIMAEAPVGAEIDG